jgi:DNA-binding CsgD family transcriptional regulator
VSSARFAKDATVRGRERELQMAAEFLREAARGRGGVLLVEGEPGIGKSALLAEVIGSAARLNFSLAEAEADELGQRAPFAPLLTALHEPIEGLAGDVSRLGAPETWMPAVDQIRAVLERRTASCPVLVSLDDLHWADPATLFALRALPRHLASYPLVWNLARSTAQPRSHAGVLFDLLERDGAVRVTLAPLAGEAAAGLIADILRAVPDSALLTLASGAAGNPVLLVELTRGLLDESAIRVSQGTASLVSSQLPQRVHAVAERRLVGLSEGARYLLETAAVLGPAFRLEDVAEMLSQPPASMLPLINEVVEAGILTVAAEAYAFRHELIWRAVSEAVPLSAQQALHRQFGGILLARGGSAMSAAAHLLQGACEGDPAVTASLDAAAEEVLRSSPRTAADLALRALELTTAADPARFSRVMRAAGTLAAAARLDEASSVVHAALAQPQPLARDTQLRCVLSSILCLQGQALQANTEAETVLGRPDLAGMLRDEVVIAQLQALIALGENARARGLAENILAAFGEHGEPALTGALSVLAAICWEDGRLDQGLHLASEAARRTNGVAPDARHFQPLFALAARLIDLRRLDQAGAVIRAATDSLQVLRPNVSETIPAILRARIDLAMGQTDDARAEAQTALNLAGTLGVAPHGALAHSVLCVIALRKGDLQTAGLHIRNRPDITHYTDAYARTETVLARAQFVEAAAGPETAMQVLDGIYAGLPVHRHVLVGEPTASAWLARTALAVGRLELATSVARVADDLARDNPAFDVIAVAAAHCGGIVSQDPARLAHAASSHPDPWARASASEDLAGVCAAMTNQDEAVAHLDDALGGYGHVGADRDLARVRRRLRRLGVRRRHWVTADRPAVGWASLTETERTTASLVAQGLSNQQAAEQMYVSAHTVSFHLRQVFRKLGIGSRVELARLVAEQPSGREGDRTDPEHPDTARRRTPGQGHGPERARGRQRG